MEISNLDPSVINYGKELEKRGYQKGYLRATLDMRKRRYNKEKSIRRLSNDFLDYLDDKIAANQKH